MLNSCRNAPSATCLLPCLHDAPLMLHLDKGVVFLRLQASHPHTRLWEAGVEQLPSRPECTRSTAISACPFHAAPSVSGCTVSRCCCSQKHAACSLFAAKVHPVLCHKSMSEAACVGAGRLRDLPLLGRHHEDGHRARAAGKAMLTANLSLYPCCRCVPHLLSPQCIPSQVLTGHCPCSGRVQQYILYT